MEYKHVSASRLKSKEAIKDFVRGLEGGDNVSADLRKSEEDMNSNYNLVAGILDKKALERAFNPMRLEGENVQIPVHDEVIPIIKPSLNALIGEEYDRNFEFRAYLTNPTDINAKSAMIKAKIDEKLVELINNVGLSQEMLELELNKLKQWQTYTAQDIRERVANHILKDQKERLNLRKVFKEGWKDVLAISEESYHIGSYSGNVVVEKIDPRDLTLYQLGISSTMEDAGIIVWHRYMQPNKIVERYFDQLKPEDTKRIMGDNGGKNGDFDSTGSIRSLYEIEYSTLENEHMLEVTVDDSTNGILGDDGDPYRSDGSVSVKSVYFRTVRPVKWVTRLNEVTGEEEVVMEDESYETVEGEESRTVYVNEWKEATEIGADIWVDIRSCPVQCTDINNYSINLPPFVGHVHTYNHKRGQSVVDILKPIQYEWSVFTKKLSHLWTRNWGKLVKIDKSRIPTGMDLDDFMAWITQHGIIVENSFEESTKGFVAGQLGNSVQSVDVELSNSIQAALGHLMYLRELADETVGVNRQRRGELMASDGLGATREAVQHSNKMTEEMFQEHDDVKKRVLKLVLENVKMNVQSGTDVRSQYVLGDMASVIYDTADSAFEESSFGIMITNSTKLLQQEQMFQQLLHAAMQAGTVKISQVIELYNTDSMREKINTLKASEEENMVKEQENAKQMQQMQQEVQKAELADKEAERAHEIQVAEIKANAQIQVALIKADSQREADEVRSNENAEKEANKTAEKEQDRAIDGQKHQDKMQIDKEKMQISRENKNNSNNK